MKSSRAAKRTKHEETGVKSCDFDAFLSEENSLYTKEEIHRRKLRGEYVPTDKANAWQIRKAAKEYCRRGLKLPGYELRSPFVKVAENIKSIPPSRKVPSHFDVNVGAAVLSVHRIVFFLHGGDLFIVKIACGQTHTRAVTHFIEHCAPYRMAREDVFGSSSDGEYKWPGNNRGDKQGKGFAPDYVLQPLFPEQNGIELLRGVFIAEVEVFHRDAGALICRLSKYAAIPQNKYLCGIKIYKDNREKVHRAAIGVVWKRENPTTYKAIKIMNFGREAATLQEIRKWIGVTAPLLGKLPPYTRGTRSRRTRNPWEHYPAVTYTQGAYRSRSNGRVQLRIPDADLVRDVKDEAGQEVVADRNLFLNIDFGAILKVSDGVQG